MPQGKTASKKEVVTLWGKNFQKSLPSAVAWRGGVGILLGLVANEQVMNVVVTVKQVLGQIITFCVPLIVIGFIAPSITARA